MMISPIQISPLTFLDPNAPAREAPAVTETQHAKMIPELARAYGDAVGHYNAARNEVESLRQHNRLPPTIRMIISGTTSGPTCPVMFSEVGRIANERMSDLFVDALANLALRVRDAYAALTAADDKARAAGELPGRPTNPVLTKAEPASSLNTPDPEDVGWIAGAAALYSHQPGPEPASDLACSPEPGSGIAGSHFGGGL